MKRLCSLIVILIFIAFSSYAAIDTFEGQSADTNSTIEGTSSIDTVEGQTLSGAAGPTYADFGTGNSEGWTEVDQGDNRLDPGTSVSNTVTFTDMDQGGTDNYLMYKDNGSGNIGNFHYQGEFNSTAHTNNTYPAAFMVADTLDDANHTTNSIALQWWSQTPTFYIRDRVSGSVDEEYACASTLSESTTYYWDVVRSGSQVTVKVYASSANRDSDTSELCVFDDQTTYSLDNGTAMQYVYALASFASDASSFLVTGTSSNFIIVSE